MRDFYDRLWASLNYRYCMSSAYLADQRGEKLVVAEFEEKARVWKDKIDDIDFQRRFA